MTVLRVLPTLLLVGLAVASAGCGDPDAEAGTAPDLAGREFVATQTNGHEQVAETEITLSFQDGRISARAGCNTMTGGATWDDGVLRVPADGLATTMMACPDDLQAQDEWLMALLTSAPALSLSGGVLTVGDDVEGMTMQEQG
jgi:heat shock protein HslJ